MSKLSLRFNRPYAGFAASLLAAAILAIPAAELAAAPVGYVYYLQTFGDWTVTCGRDEASGRDSCTLGAPPPERHGDSQIEIGSGQGGDDGGVTVRVRGALMQGSPLYLRVDAKSPHQTQPNRFGEGRWNGDEAEAIIAELNAGQRAVIRSFSGPPPTPVDAFFSLERFRDALADFDRRTSGKPAAETAQAAPEPAPPAEAPPPVVAAAPVTAPPPSTEPPRSQPETPVREEQPIRPVQNEQPRAVTEQPEPGYGRQATERPAPSGPAGEPVAILEEAYVGRARLTSNVVNREPVDELGARVDVPSAGETSVFFFTEVRGMGGRKITHRWEYAGATAASVSFPIGSDRWRVYSRKSIAANQTGPWKVVALGPDGTELARAEFVAD